MSIKSKDKVAIKGFALVPMGHETSFFERPSLSDLNQFRADRKRLSKDYKSASEKMLKILADYFDKQRSNQLNAR